MWIDLREIDRSTGRAAKLVSDQLRRLTVVVRPRPRLADGVVSMGFEQRPVELVRPAPGGHNDRRRPVELGRGVVVLHTPRTTPYALR